MSPAALNLKVLAEGRCRLCERPSSVRPLTRHRIVPGAVGGRYLLENVVPLCRPCHDLIDNLKDSDERIRYRRMLRAVLWPQEIAYGYSQIGARFDDLYPRSSREYVLRFRRGEPPELLERPLPRLVRLPRRSGVSGWVETRPRHLRHCKASSGGCASGCPVAALSSAVEAR